ncbi:hypothetical protein L9F63_015925, partial [Diploptera punctata]
MASASSPSVERSCLCGTVNSCPPTSRSNTAKCKICRTKPKFSFLRGQRSLDLGQQGPSSTGLNGYVVTTPPGRSSSLLSKEAEAIRDPSRGLPQGRRARSAERYEGLRVNDRNSTGLPRQTSLQTPMMSTSSDQPPEYVYPELPPITSPPPTYEVAMGKMGHPPSYEEYLAQKLNQQQITPPPLPPRNPTMSSSPPPPWSTQQQATSSHNLCTCTKCKTGVRGAGGLMVELAKTSEEAAGTTSRNLADTQRQLRVVLPPEISSSHDHCPCAKCQ